MLHSYLWHDSKQQYLLFILLFLATVILIPLAANYKYQNHNHLQRALIELKNEIDQFKEAKEQYKTIQEYQKPFMELVRSNFVGDEQRINWIESLDRIVTENHLPEVKFTLKPKVNNQPELFFVNAQDTALYQSQMDLDFRLLHELDLFTLLQKLKQETNGLFIINHCYLENLLEDNISIIQEPILKGKCTLLWFTTEKFFSDTEFDDAASMI